MPRRPSLQDLPRPWVIAALAGLPAEAIVQRARPAAQRRWPGQMAEAGREAARAERMPLLLERARRALASLTH